MRHLRGSSLVSLWRCECAQRFLFRSKHLPDVDRAQLKLEINDLIDYQGEALAHRCQIPANMPVAALPCSLVDRNAK